MSQLLDAHGQPYHRTQPQPAREPDACPGCGAPKSMRVHGGFGADVEVCNRCGHEFSKEASK
jgi:ribosomal protein L37AE/L43A